MWSVLDTDLDFSETFFSGQSLYMAIHTMTAEYMPASQKCRSVPCRLRQLETVTSARDPAKICSGCFAQKTVA